MKKLSYLALAGLLVAAVSCNDEPEKDQGREMGNLHLSKQHLKPGDKVKIKYKRLGDSTEAPEAYAYYLVGANSYPVDIDLKDSLGNWMGELQIPDTVQAVSFNFKNGKKWDNNEKKGYLVALEDEKNQAVAGANASMGFFYTSQGERYNIQNDSSLAMIQKQMDDDAEFADKFDTRYGQLLSNEDEEKSKKFVESRIAYYESKDTLKAEDYGKLASFYRAHNERAKSDSISELGAKRFPKGKLAQSDFQMKFYQAKGIPAREAILADFNKQVGKKGEIHEFMMYYLAQDYANENNWEKFYAYSDSIEDPGRRASIYNNVAWDMVTNDKNLEKASEISQKSIDLIKSSKSAENKPDYYSKKQYEDQVDYNTRMYQDTYAFAQFKLGNEEEALKIMEEAYTDDISGEMAERYVQFLNANEQYEKAQEEGETILAENRGTDKTREYLKEAYFKNEGSDENFDEYLADIEERAKEKAKDDLTEEMITEDAPAFTMKDLKGNDVSLADLKGKTVILDFWATWCGPCKRSFPGMKMAVEQFGKDDNVEFLFVDTFEDMPDRPAKLTEFLTENDYPFHVVIDEKKSESSNSYNVASAYNITGIPTKVIIGPDGKMKFKLVGYDGNNDKLMQEIGLMIEILNEDTAPQA